MGEEVVTILKFDTDVKSVNDLRNNIKILKENLGDLEIGTQEKKKKKNNLQPIRCFHHLKAFGVVHKSL